MPVGVERDALWYEVREGRQVRTQTPNGRTGRRVPGGGGLTARMMDVRYFSPEETGGDDALGSMPSTNSATYAKHSRLLSGFDRFASRVTRCAGSPVAFASAFATVVVWAIAGPFFEFSENWQLVINTGTTIITFLMVFLIQQGQNKDSVALHLKLNELLAANRQASNRMIGIEALDEQDLREVALFYVRLAERAKTAGPNKECHSIDEEGMPTDGNTHIRTPSPELAVAPQRCSDT